MDARIKELKESITIIEKNIEAVKTGRSKEFDLDELEEELSYLNEELELEYEKC